MKLFTKLSYTQLLIISAILTLLLLLLMSYSTLVKKNTSPPFKTILENQNTIPSLTSQPHELSLNDRLARDKLIREILHGYESGIIYESSTLRIEYVSSVDHFQAEITTPDIAYAKDEATAWFTSKGISKQGLCFLPIYFHPSQEVTAKLENANSFNPLLDDC